MKTAKDVPIEELAKWALVGFGRCWCLYEVFLAAGYPIADTDPYLCEIAKFIPNYSGRHTQIRAIIFSQYPKLADALDKGLRTEKQVAAAISFLSNAVAKDEKKSGAISKSDKRVMYRDRKKYLATVMSTQGKYERNNTGMSGWKVCK